MFGKLPLYGAIDSDVFRTPTPVVAGDNLATKNLCP